MLLAWNVIILYHSKKVYITIVQNALLCFLAMIKHKVVNHAHLIVCIAVTTIVRAVLNVIMLNRIIIKPQNCVYNVHKLICMATILVKHAKSAIPIVINVQDHCFLNASAVIIQLII